MGKCYTFKGQSLESGPSCIFQAIESLLNLEQRQKNTKVKAKEIDPLWSQIGLSRLHPVSGFALLCIIDMRNI